MELLAKDKNDDVLIQAIDSESGTTKIAGLTLRPELADAFARNIHDALQPLGWDIQSGVEPVKTGGLWKFELIVRDAAGPKPAALPTTAERRRS